MDSFFAYSLSLLAFMLVIEGLFYALFPKRMKTILISVLAMPTKQLRSFGTFMVLSGFFLLWVLSSLG